MWQKLPSFTILSGGAISVKARLGERAAERMMVSAEAMSLPHKAFYVAGIGAYGIAVRLTPGELWQTLLHAPTLSSLTMTDGGQVLYMGTNQGQVWRSSDRGWHWSRVDRDLPGGPFLGTIFSPHAKAIGRLTISPRDPAELYAVLRKRLYQTANGGGSWRRLTIGPPGLDIVSVAVDDQEPAHIWVGTQFSGLYHSADAGRTWLAAHEAGLPAPAWVEDITVSPRDSRTIYVSAMDLSSPTGGPRHPNLYWSTNGGAHWEHVGQGLPDGLNLFCPTVNSAEPQRMYVADENAGIYYSRNGGTLWMQGTGPPEYEAINLPFAYFDTEFTWDRGCGNVYA